MRENRTILKGKEIKKLLNEIEEARKKIQECVLRLEEMNIVILEPSGPGDEPESMEPSEPIERARGSEITIKGDTIKLIVH